MGWELQMQSPEVFNIFRCSIFWCDISCYHLLAYQYVTRQMVKCYIVDIRHQVLRLRSTVTGIIDESMLVLALMASLENA